jgi:hypothetical protein
MNRSGNWITIGAMMFMWALPTLRVDATCCGDCNGNGRVAINELITSVNDELNGCPMRFVDNGNGTITDNQTGLMWEKKTTAVNSGENLADPHDVDNLYTWSADSAPPYKPTGTAFTDLLYGFNAGSSPNGEDVNGCLAGHCDWRLPSVDELETILLKDDRCLVHPCIDALFGPTQSDDYVSNLTSLNEGVPDFVWEVSFDDGVLGASGKQTGHFVRAVRCGR